MKFYLLGGFDMKSVEKAGEIERKVLSEAKNGNVYVLDLTSNNKEKLAKYREVLTSYFEKVGMGEAKFISDSSSFDQIKKEIKEAGVVYIPGGLTETLMENLKKYDLKSTLSSLDSILIGNSAGALAICDEVILTKDEDVFQTKFLPGLGLVPFSVEVHYDETHNEELFELSKKRDIYAIPENCAVVYNGEMSFVGDIWKFSKGKKEKIN